MTGRIIPFPWRERRLSPEEGWKMAERVLATPVEDRTSKSDELHLDDPELLLAICEVLRSRLETSPAVVRDDAEFFYRFLEKPKRKIGLYDEREYYMGELALTAGGGGRGGLRREEGGRRGGAAPGSASSRRDR